MTAARRLSPLLVVALAASLVALPAAGAQTPSFTGKPAVLDADAGCIARGKARGRVVVEALVRYPDARGRAARHSVRSSLTLVGPSGRVLARDEDRGSAQVAIPGLSAYRHVHQHLLGRAASRAVLGGSSCADGALVRVRVRASQRLSSRGGASAAQAAAQSASATVTAPVAPVAGAAPVVNGCKLVGQDTNCHGADLNGQDLSGLELPYSDFSFANLANANLSGARLGHVIMNQTVLDGANLSGAQVGVAGLTDVSAQGTDFTNAQLPFTNLANATLTNAKLAGANLEATSLYGTVFDNAGCDAKTIFPSPFPHRCSNGVVVSG